MQEKEQLSATEKIAERDDEMTRMIIKSIRFDCWCPAMLMVEECKYKI